LRAWPRVANDDLAVAKLNMPSGMQLAQKVAGEAPRMFAAAARGDTKESGSN